MKYFFLVTAVFLAFVPLTAKADLLLGTLIGSGTADISFGTIDFLDNVLLVNPPASSQQGGFMTIAGTTATIQNVQSSAAGGDVNVGPLDIPDFITFADAPNISITVTYLLAGIDPEDASGACLTPVVPAAGQVCTPYLPQISPFNLQNLSATSSSASFSILGFEVDSTTGDTVPIVGTFTAPFATETYQTVATDVLATLSAPPGLNCTTYVTGCPVQTSYSAQIVTLPPTSTPEPGTLLLLLTGFGGLIWKASRLRRLGEGR